MAVVLLLRRRKEAVNFGIARSLPALRIAERIQANVAAGIEQARVISRRAGAESLAVELESLDVTASELSSSAIIHLGRDARRANVFARNYANAWVRNAEGQSVAQAAHAADAQTVGSLKRIAVTESSEAFNGGRSSAAEGTRTSLLKVWDASLDKRTCPVCASADGTIVGIKESFPLGQPGGVHPWCRCTWSALSLTEHGNHSTIEPKPVGELVSLANARKKP